MTIRRGYSSSPKHGERAYIRLGSNALARAVSGPGLVLDEPKEGKINITAACDGLLYAWKEGILALNTLDGVILATLHNHYPVKKGDKVAGTRVVPLMIDEKVILKAEKLLERTPNLFWMFGL